MARSRKRMLGIIAGIGFLVLLVLGGAVFVERTRGAQELEEILAELRTAKVELDPARVVTNSVPEEENVAMALLGMTNELQAFRLPEEVAPIPLMKVTDAGEARSCVAVQTFLPQLLDVIRVSKSLVLCVHRRLFLWR